MAVRILTYYQVNPAFLNFLLVFGSRSRPKDFRFSGFRSNIIFTYHFNGVAPRQFQISYNLNTVELSGGALNSPSRQWQPRRCAIHHQFNTGSGSSTWITASIRDSIEKRTNDLLAEEIATASEARLGKYFATTLEVHLVYCQWAMEDWRWYLQWLEEAVDEVVRPLKL
jgi:hypothetical protein